MKSKLIITAAALLALSSCSPASRAALESIGVRAVEAGAVRLEREISGK